MLKLECINYLGEYRRNAEFKTSKGLMVATFILEECDTVDKYIKFLPHLTQFIREYNEKLSENK